MSTGIESAKKSIMRLSSDIVGAGIGRTEGGDPCIHVYVRNAEVAAALPVVWLNWPVRTVVTGDIVAS